MYLLYHFNIYKYKKTFILMHFLRIQYFIFLSVIHYPKNCFVLVNNKLYSLQSVRPQSLWLKHMQKIKMYINNTHYNRHTCPLFWYDTHNDQTLWMLPYDWWRQTVRNLWKKKKHQQLNIKPAMYADSVILSMCCWPLFVELSIL